MKTAGNIIIRLAVIALAGGMLLSGCQKIVVVQSGSDMKRTDDSITDPALVEVITKEVQTTAKED